MTNAKEEYRKRLDIYHQQLQQLTRKSNLLSNLRLLVMTIGLAGTIWLYFLKMQGTSTIVFFTTLLVFIVLVVMHERVHRTKDKTESLYRINEQGIKRFDGEWKGFKETGEVFADENHFFSWDLDIFGKASLFQRMNAAETYIGKEKLKASLITPQKSCEAIAQRQEAIKELAGKIDWRQRFQAAGMAERDAVKAPDQLLRWSKERNAFYRKPWVNWPARILPVLTIVAIISAAMFPKMPYFIAVLLLLLQIFALGIRFKEMFKILNVVDTYRRDIKTYETMIGLIEQESFHSSYINALKKRMQGKQGETIKQQIRKLDKILDWVSFRHAQFYILFNILTLWDYHCTIAVEQWKERYGCYLAEWIACLGEIEALSSLAVIAFEQPQWSTPKIVSEQKICTRQMGHPLIADEQRVCNDISFGEEENVLLITGSNMSGKSTFLRTLGINLVLAYAGAPVCAEAFECPILEIYTSMRVKDNLEQNISSFYAELLRIKTMIEAAAKGEPIFFLLDEIFKGTNSRDRHIGAKTLIRKLSGESALGLVSTHDLELSKLAEEKKTKMQNYHFQEYYKDGQIFFDYHLYPGVSTTLNAIYLMKQAGIEIEELPEQIKI